MQIQPATNPPILLAFPFRLFFLLTAAYAALAVPAWLGRLLGHWPLPLGNTPALWHSHEILFGVVTAAITGFVLTAVCNWTGAPPLQGRKLLALALLWLAGRLVMWGGTWLHPVLVAAIDLAFLPVLALYLFGVLRRHGNTRNLILVAVLGLLFLANLWMHLGFIGGNVLRMQQGELLAINLITLLMVVIAGRIIPAFTANWLRLHGGNANSVRVSPMWERLTLVSTLLIIPTDWFANSYLSAAVALTAGLVNGVRLAHWAGWQTGREPLLWILHLGYAWIVVGLGLKGLAALDLVAATVWQHALGTGAMGTLILGVMTRVGLGHTGRPLQLPRFALWIYLAILVAAITRLLTALLAINYQTGLMISGAAWTLAFVLFLLTYWPILSRPRADGATG